MITFKKKFCFARIIFICGPSGSGKNTFRNCLLNSALGKNLYCLPSYTTRPIRPFRDREGEFVSISEKEFNSKEQSGEFLWTVCVHGRRYATLRDSVGEVFHRQTETAIMIGTIDKLPELDKYCQSIGFYNNIAPVYIQAPNPFAVALRLRRRGEGLWEIFKRLISRPKWDKLARKLSRSYPIQFVSNKSDRKNLESQAILLLKQLGT